METLLSHTATNWREGRRLRALELHQQGWKQTRIAQALGITQGAVSQWLARVQADGPAALLQRPVPGRPPKLSREQRATLPHLLAQGAPAFGFAGDVWTCERVAEIIAREWQVHYHPMHVRRLLHQCGFSQQKPVRRARQRNEAAIAEWQETTWPALKKRRKKRDGSSSS